MIFSLHTAIVSYQLQLVTKERDRSFGYGLPKEKSHKRLPYVISPGVTIRNHQSFDSSINLANRLNTKHRNCTWVEMHYSPMATRIRNSTGQPSNKAPIRLATVKNTSNRQIRSTTIGTAEFYGYITSEQPTNHIKPSNRCWKVRKSTWGTL